MFVPYLDLGRQFRVTRDEIMGAVNRVIDQGTFILGNEVKLFESEWACYCGSRGAVGVATGTDALALALTAVGAVRRGRNDEVITTPLTAGYTALAIQLAGGVPVFADIKPDDFTLDPGSIEDSITPRTTAIVPVHLYGQVADMTGIESIARDKGLWVIEDAAQAHGARYRGKSVGTFGHAAAFSLYPTKNLGALGDGGIVIAQDFDILNKVRTLRQGAHYEALQAPEGGVNSRLDEIQAAILRVKLKYLEKWNAQRRNIASLYSAGIKGLDIRLPQPRDPESHVFHLYVVSHPQRDRFRAFLSGNGVETLIHYPYLLHQQPLFRSKGQRRLPIAEQVGQTIFSLPLNPWLRPDEVDYVIETMNRFESI